jgi:oligoribonuclease
MGAQSDRLVWMDLEFSGLEPEGGDVILEVATLITDSELNMIAEGPVLAIHHGDDILNGMDEWNTKHHHASGLVKRVKVSQHSHESADELTAAFILEHCRKGSSPLCGNSIHQDRRFMYPYMPKVSECLHYRNIDVSTLKELSKRWTPEIEPFQKKKAHLALDDIRESIEELSYLRNAWDLGLN